MDDTTSDSLTFIVKEIIDPENYSITTIRRNIIIKLNDGFSYLISGDITGMGLNLSCPMCGNFPSKTDIGSVISGNGVIMGIIMCVACRHIKLCVFDEKSEIAIKRALEIGDDIINHKWGDFSGQYIQ